MRRWPRTAIATTLSRDGWAALCLGVLAQTYLVGILALTGMSLIPLALGWHGSVIQTGSMRPHIDPGDLVLLSDLSDDSPVPLGGVVEFSTPAAAEPDGESGQRLHRVVGEGEGPGEWVTAGDANADVDSTAITRDQITGQARILVPWIGLPSLAIGNGDLLLLVLWLAGTILAIVVRVWWWPERRPPAPDGPDDDASGDPMSVLAGVGSGVGPNGATNVEADAGEDAGAGASPGASRGAASPPGEVTRRSAMAALVLIAVGAGSGIGTHSSASAGFSARTVSARNTFSVARSPALTLGRAATYAVLAATRITNQAFFGIGSSIDGSVAVSPGTSVAGFWPWDITGDTDRNPAGARNARTDAVVLFDALGNRSTTATLPATATGTLRPGVYRRSGAAQVTQTLTLDARGDASAVFVLAANSIVVAQNARVVLQNGASADRVFFRSASTIAVGEASTCRGTFIASGDITMARGSTLTGSAVSLNGAVALTQATITRG